MQATALDRDDRHADTALQIPSADDTGAQDTFDLWLDLGGSD